MTNEETAIKTTYFSIIGNTCLALIKGLAGYFGNSYALIADAIESTTDSFASFLVFYILKKKLNIIFYIIYLYKYTPQGKQ